MSWRVGTTGSGKGLPITGIGFKLSSWVFVVSVVLLGCKGRPSTPSVADSDTGRLNSIRGELAGGGRLSPDDAKFIVSVIQSKSPDAAGALFTLGLATKARMYPGASFEQLVREKVKDASQKDFKVYFDELPFYLDLNGRPSDATLSVFPSLMQTGTPSALSSNERKFIATGLSSSKFGDQRFAATLLCSKSKLDSATLNWSEAMVGPKVKKTRGKELVFWNFVKDELAARS